MKERIEVLAPAGNPAALKAAVYAGADAVYMGGAAFSARANAVNFSEDDLRQAVAFARERNVRVYVTVNTLVKEGELPAALAFCRFLCSLPVDGILIQDLGLFALLRQACPEMPLHASTQMSIHSPEGAAFLQQQGASRVVLAREMSLQEIEAVHRRTDVELEAFVHGALCMSLSGQCYFSAMLGSRSGNRGRCAQPCRLPFCGPGGTGHDLSLKDMSFIDHIGRLSQVGVCSAKIEGRMKRPEYVAAAVSACRHAADGEAVPEKLLENLGAVFSRSGFTDGYLTAHRGKAMFGIRRKEDVEEASGAVFAGLHELYKNELQRVPVTFHISVRTGEHPVLTASDGTHTVTVVWEEQVAEAARKLPVDTQRWQTQLQKTGGTPYRCTAVTIETDDQSVVPVSALNGMRRAALEQLGAQREKKPAVPFTLPKLQAEEHEPGAFSLWGRFHSVEQLPENADRLEKIILPLDTPLQTLSALRAAGHEMVLEIPRAIWGVEPLVEDAMRQAMAQDFTHFFCGNVAAVALCSKLGATAHGSFGLNLYNTHSLAAYAAWGVQDAELSFELTQSEVRQVGGKTPRGLMVYGRQPLMLTRNCPLMNSGKGCLGCETARCITDRMHVDFPVQCTKWQGRPIFSEVLNSVPLNLSDQLDGSERADFGILHFTVENAVEIRDILEGFLQRKKPHSDCTRGLFTRGVL